VDVVLINGTLAEGDTVVACHVRGRVSDEALLAAEALARGAAARVAVFQKAGLVKSLAAAAGEGVTAGAVS
jgi:translation initiation factor IF-2